MEILLYAGLGMLFITAICAMMALFSWCTGLITAGRRSTAVEFPEIPEPITPEPVKTEPMAPMIPHVELIETDEATAAVLMAIAAEQSGIPIDRLEFKRIKLLHADLTNAGGTP